jgi:predicted metal-dependent HD superfamily phosphohydrolase
MNLSDDLKSKWLTLAAKYSDDGALANRLWEEIELNYSASARHYHTLGHIGKLLAIFGEYEVMITGKDAVEFAIWYHDIIYVPGRSDNETESARLAEKRMLELGVDEKIITTTIQLIEATKTHALSEETDNFDGRFLLDADLSILGADWEEYELYARQIRQEFYFVEKSAYVAGRGGVMQDFLKRERIYKTEEFFQKLGKKARENIERELVGLEAGTFW